MNLAEAVSASFDEALEHGPGAFKASLSASWTSEVLQYYQTWTDLGGKVNLTPREAASPQLTYRDLEDLREHAPSLRHISGARFWRLRYEGPLRAYEGNVVAAVPDYAQVNDIEPSHGRYLTDLDLRHRTNVVVMGSAYADSLFGSAEAAMGRTRPWPSAAPPSGASASAWSECCGRRSSASPPGRETHSSTGTNGPTSPSPRR